jgi:hypothetical protein
MLRVVANILNKQSWIADKGLEDWLVVCRMPQTASYFDVRLAQVVYEQGTESSGYTFVGIS